MEAFSDVTFNSLRKVELRGARGSDRVMQLIKLLLSNSPMLKTMLIETFFNYDDASEKVKTENPVVLNSFRRALPEVEVFYDFYVD